MPRYKPYDYSQLQMVPVSLNDQLMPGTLEHAIHARGHMPGAHARGQLCTRDTSSSLPALSRH
jgi:hypothetical protein